MGSQSTGKDSIDLFRDQETHVQGGEDGQQRQERLSESQICEYATMLAADD